MILEVKWFLNVYNAKSRQNINKNVNKEITLHNETHGCLRFVNYEI